MVLVSIKWVSIYEVLRAIEVNEQEKMCLELINTGCYY